MTSEDPVPQNPDRFSALLERAASVLQQTLGGRVVTGPAEQLSDEHRRNLLLRIPLLEAPAGAPASIVLKQADANSYDPENGGIWATRGLFADWAGLEFLNLAGAGETGCPRFYGGDREAGFVLMEDLTGSGDTRSSDLATVLRHGTASEAEEGLKRLATTLGQMHAATIGKAEQYHQIRRALGPGDHEEDRSRDAREWQNTIREILEHADTLGVPRPAGLDEDIQSVTDSQQDPGPFFAYTHGDPCPDNCLLAEGRLRLFDYEIGAFRHALRDGVYGRILFPTCWCVGRIPDPIVEAMDRAYRAELVKGCPAAQDDAVYDRAATETCAAWLLAFTLGYIQPSQYADATWGISTFRQRAMERCRRFVALSERTGFLPALRTWVESLDAALRARWLPDTEEMRFYEAFLTPVKPDPLATADLFKAIEDGSLDDLSRLLAADPSLANARSQDDHRTPALQRALEKNRPEMVRLLAQKGVDLTTLDGTGRTAWAPAIQHCDPATVQFLVDQGLDPNKRDFGGQLPLYMAIESQRPEMVSLLTAAGARIDFLAAARLHDLETAASLLAAEPERAAAASIRGETLLHQVAALGDTAVPFAALLLEHGADVNRRSGGRHTPLQIALEGNHEGMVALLKEHGAEG